MRWNFFIKAGVPSNLLALHESSRAERGLF